LAVEDAPAERLVLDEAPIALSNRSKLPTI